MAVAGKGAGKAGWVAGETAAHSGGIVGQRGGGEEEAGGEREDGFVRLGSRVLAKSQHSSEVELWKDDIPGEETEQRRLI